MTDEMSSTVYKKSDSVELSYCAPSLNLQIFVMQGFFLNKAFNVERIVKYDVPMDAIQREMTLMLT